MKEHDERLAKAKEELSHIITEIHSQILVNSGFYMLPELGKLLNLSTIALDHPCTQAKAVKLLLGENDDRL